MERDRQVPKPGAGGQGENGHESSKPGKASLSDTHSPAASGAGVPLPSGLQKKFESSLGVDLSGVRVHVGEHAASAASAVSAKAFAHGQDVFLGEMFPSVETVDEHLLAHEVAHTVQQRGATPITQLKPTMSRAGDASEQEADKAADAMVAGKRATVGPSPIIVARTEGATPASSTPPGDTPGLAMTEDILKKHPDTMLRDLGGVVRQFPNEREAIAARLKQEKRLPGADTTAKGVAKVLAYADDRLVVYNYGRDPSATPYDDGAHVVEGGGKVSEVGTTPRQAIVLNDIRASTQRFNPAYLLAFQKQLHVADSSGAFNTETLKALLGQPQLASVAKLASEGQAHEAARIILSNEHGWLENLVATSNEAAKEADGSASGSGDSPGGSRPPEKLTAFTATSVAWNASTEAKDRLSPRNMDIDNGHRADRVAKSLGYDSFKAYYSTWVEVSLLGVKFRWPKVHPSVAERLAVAERWLRQRHAGKSDAQIIQAIGWNRDGVGGYNSEEDLIGREGFANGAATGVHMHSFGLAFDISPGVNPYVFQDGSSEQYYNLSMEAHLRRAAQLYGGEVITPAKLDEWGKKLSTEELQAKIQRANVSLQQYLEAPKAIKVDEQNLPRARAKGESATDYAAAVKTARDAADAQRLPVLAAKLTAIGYSPEEANRAASEWLDFVEDHRLPKLDASMWGLNGRGASNKFTTHSQDMVVAMRDVAGFSWGGAEISPKENGDFMHFDLRNTDFGATVLSAALTQPPATDEKLDAEKKVKAEADAKKAK